MTFNGLRVLMVTGIYPTEQHPHAGTFIKSQVDALIAAGLKVDILHPRPGPPPLRYISAAIQVFGKTLTGRYDIVHGHYGLWCLIARLQWRAPVVASFLGDDILGTIAAEGRYSTKGQIVAAISRKLCYLADAVIVKSTQMKERARGPQHKIFVIPNGVNFEQFRPIPREEVRSMLGWDQQRYYVLFSNNPAIPVKNFPLARAAVECVRSKGFDVELVVASGLPHTTVAAYMNASNALILTSLAEGSPNVVKEAMACNVPVIATNVGDVAFVIGRTDGCHVCPHNPEKLAQALETVLQHSERTTGRHAISHLDNAVVAQQIITLYIHIIYSKKHDTDRNLLMHITQFHWSPLPVATALMTSALALRWGRGGAINRTRSRALRNYAGNPSSVATRLIASRLAIPPANVASQLASLRLAARQLQRRGGQGKRYIGRHQCRRHRGD